MLSRTEPHPNITEYNPTIRQVAQEYLKLVEWIKANGIDSTDDVLPDLKRLARTMLHYVCNIDPMDVVDTEFWNKMLRPCPSVVGEFLDYGITLSHRVEDGTYHFSLIANKDRVDFGLTFDWPDQAVQATGVSRTAVN